MPATDWIAIVALLLGGGGLGAGARGGIALTAKITRLVVAVEDAGKAITTIVEDVRDVKGTLNTHTVTLAEHGQQLDQLRQAKP